MGSGQTQVPVLEQNKIWWRDLMLLAVIVCRLDTGSWTWIIWCIHRGQKGRLVKLYSFLSQAGLHSFWQKGNCSRNVKGQSTVSKLRSPKSLETRGTDGSWHDLYIIINYCFFLLPVLIRMTAPPWTIIIPMSSCQPWVIIIFVL